MGQGGPGFMYGSQATNSFMNAWRCPSTHPTCGLLCGAQALSKVSLWLELQS